MPILKRRYDHTKVYRPAGTRWATARNPEWRHAVAEAFAAFRIEFGEEPKQCWTVIEVVGVTGDWVADVFEVKGDER